MKKIIFTIAAILTSCAMEPIWPTGELYPFTTSDGKHKFNYTAHNKLAKHLKAHTTLKEIHDNQISGLLGKQRYCQNGWTIDSIKEIELTDSIIYKGTCK